MDRDLVKWWKKAHETSRLLVREIMINLVLAIMVWIMAIVATVNLLNKLNTMTESQAFANVPLGTMLLFAMVVIPFYVFYEIKVIRSERRGQLEIKALLDQHTQEVKDNPLGVDYRAVVDAVEALPGDGMDDVKAIREMFQLPSSGPGSGNSGTARTT
jgi:hypothetical protein